MNRFVRMSANIAHSKFLKDELNLRLEHNDFLKKKSRDLTDKIHYYNNELHNNEIKIRRNQQSIEYLKCRIEK